ncbi:MAG: hypothetical protein Q4G39_02060 [Brachymonas sp.]|nr:hypothetical protein [Brachymonas sp.]
MKHARPVLKQRFGPRHEKGITLIVAMVLLIALTIIVASALKVNMVNSKIVGNLQMQREGEAASQQAIENILRTNFTNLPAQMIQSIDINNSGKTGFTYTVTLPAPKCVSVRPIMRAELDASSVEDRLCDYSLVSSASMIDGGSAQNKSSRSLCSNSIWDVSASATLPNSTIQTAPTHQGVAVKVTEGSAC